MASVLILEPSADVRALLERAILRLGHEPLTHTRGEEAGAREADVVLLEPAFAGGVELAQALRATRPGLAIVICSIFPPSPALYELDPIAHVLKPFQRETLEIALEAAVAASG